jgi:DNA-binding PadR family transcriptional regulator
VSRSPIAVRAMATGGPRFAARILLPSIYQLRYYREVVRDGMREPTFLILTALVEGRLHGYGVIQSVLALSDARVRLRPGTVYGALDRLESEGMVASDGEEVECGRVRRYFRLTALGQQALAAETDRLAANVRVARKALGRVQGRPQRRMA